MESFRSIDGALLRAARTRLHQRPLERAVQAYSALGENGALWMALATCGAIVDRGRRRRWLLTAATVPAALAVNFGVKAVVKRQRPRLQGLEPLGHSVSSLSFPSAHATTSFAGGYLISALVPERRKHLLIAASVMAASRVYLGMHYPSDVLAGVFLGTYIGSAAEPLLGSGRR